MIEIILRKNIDEYVSKPIFGHSRREVATYGAMALLCGVLGYILVVHMKAPFEVAIPPLLAAGGAVGYVGFGQPHGMYVERYVRIRRDDASHPRTMLYARPRPRIEGGRTEPADARTRAEVRSDRRAARADLDELRRTPDELLELPTDQ